jgi:single-stranded DNA-binding protein
MTAQISAYGRLVADPQTRTTTNGNSMAMGRLAVSLPAMQQAGELLSGWALLPLANRPTRWPTR